jgi:hypothetical protein
MDEASYKQFKEALCEAAAIAPVVAEFSRCPKCGAAQFHFHQFCETLACQSETCGHTYASTVVRQPIPGEVTEKHLRLAITTLHEAYKNQQQTTLSAPSREEIAALPVEMQLIVARQSVAASKHVLEKAVSLAESFAELRNG